MPIEIRELHIRVTVNAPSAGGGATAQPASQPPASGGSGEDKDALIAECVEQVLQILQEKQER
ncbi:hypothetical protein GO755_25905 [Spirosoma sp. HMF4905]|uniref:Uncharacterized protein n=1 Tax=Spirosoma arboris TaxID=2682092 RepID=A0A7K1SIF1_9BACT|nr:DUF5908 family protein [Spirosoma arboris]MVM33498.1 hypothetical protein [Spirosoma arboris]